MYVSIDPNGGKITATVYITGLVHWSYSYTSANKKIINQQESPSSMKHSLQDASALIGKRNYWEFRITNQGRENAKYSVRVVWSQNGKELSKKYEFSSTLKANGFDRLNGYLKFESIQNEQA